MTTPVPVVYFDKGQPPHLANPPSVQRIMELERSCEWFHERAVGFALEAQPHVAPPPKRRGRPPGVRPPVEQPEPPIDQRGKVKALEACRDYLKRHPRGGYLARWFREGQQDLRAVANQAYARGDRVTEAIANQLWDLGVALRLEVHRELALPADIGRVQPEGEA